MENKIKELEEKVKELEQKLESILPNSKQETILISPVKVVNKDGKLVAEITSEQNDNSIRMYNTEGQAVANLGTDGTKSGYLAIKNESGKLVGYLDVENHGARLQVNSNDAEGAGVTIFGSDAESTGGGINIIPADKCGGISLWATSKSGEIIIDDTTGKELKIDINGI